MNSVSDTPCNYFCAVRRRRARPAHAHDAPFTRSHAHTPGIEPPKRFRTRSNPTPVVARARQALFKTLRSTCASWCADATATGRLADRARCAPVARVQCACTPRAFAFMCTPHLMLSYSLRAGDAGVHARRGQWRSPTTWRRSLLITINGQMPRELRRRAARTQVRRAPRGRRIVRIGGCARLQVRWTCPLPFHETEWPRLHVTHQGL